MNTLYQNDTIIALATPSGAGAIAIIRLSGPEAITMVDAFFKSIHPKNLVSQKTHTIHLGHIVEDSRVLDEVLVSVFKNPKSYTGEDVIEISCHGSSYIQQEIIQLFVRHGARIANPGEFTLRAFLNAKLDLSQAEAVADLIASDNKASHQIAMQQMRGGFSNEIKVLRDELLNFASLIELELDFSEEDVEFANRAQMKNLILQILKVITRLINSFELGNVIKNGIPVVIAGKPNVGKSTLMNAILNKRIAKVGDEPAITKQQQRHQINDHMILVDTPGMMWPKIEHTHDGYLLAANNNIGKNAYNEEDVAIELGEILLQQYPELLKTRYEARELTFDSIELLEFIAQKKNFPPRNHLPDLEKAAIVLLNDYRQGYLGKISIESPESRKLKLAK